MKKYLLILLGIFLSAQSISAITADDICGKMVLWYTTGSHIELSMPNESGACVFEKVSDTQVKLVHWPYVEPGSLTFNISDNNLVLPIKSKSADYTDGYDQTNHPFVLNICQEYLGNTTGNNPTPYWTTAYYQWWTVIGYIPQAYNNLTWAVVSQPDGTFSIDYIAPNSQYLVIGDKQNGYLPSVYKSVHMRIMADNGVETMTSTDGSRQSSVYVASDANNNIVFYNFGANGFTFSTSEDGKTATPTYGVAGTINTDKHTVTLPRQQIGQTTTGGMPGINGDNWYGYSNDFRNGTEMYEFAESGQKTVSPASPVKWYLQGSEGSNGSAINGTYADVLAQTGNRWAVDCGGNLAYTSQRTYTFPNIYLYCAYDQSSAGYSSTVQQLPAPAEGLALENNMVQCGVSAPADAYPVYVAGNLHLTENAEYFDHAELYLVNGRIESVAGRTDLNTTTGINGAIDITAHKHSWNMVACGVLSQAQLDAMELSPEAWESYADNNLMRNCDGYIYYNQLVPQAVLSDAGMLPAAQPSQAPGVRREIVNQAFPYTVFAKVYYTDASGLQPTFHGLKTRWTTTGLDDVPLTHSAPATELGHYDLQGRSIDPMAPGVHIIRLSDGTARKQVVQ